MRRLDRLRAATLLSSLATLAAADTLEFAAEVPPALLTPDRVETEMLGTLEFFDGMPLPETAARLYDHLDFHRGVETFHTGIPAASVYAIIEGLRAEGVAPGDPGIFETLLDARSLLLTPNTTSLYAWGSIDLTGGPVVMELPPCSASPKALSRRRSPAAGPPSASARARPSTPTSGCAPFSRTR